MDDYYSRIQNGSIILILILIFANELKVLLYVKIASLPFTIQCYNTMLILSLSLS